MERQDSPAPVVVLGATSLVGRHLVARLAARGNTGLCLTRRAAPPGPLPGGFSWHPLPPDGRLSVPTGATVFALLPIFALPEVLERLDGGGPLVGLSTSSAVFKAGGTDPAETALAESVVRAEAAVIQSCARHRRRWTLFRPTLIYDPGHDTTITAIAAFVRRFGVVPVVWPGTGLRQPIHADDVAAAMVAAMDAPGIGSVRLDLPGAETLPYAEIVRRVFVGMGRRPRLLYLPLGLARAAMAIWRRWTGAAYTLGTLERMNRDQTLDPEPARTLLGITGRPFHPTFPDTDADAKAPSRPPPPKPRFPDPPRSS